ncbi:MAG: hypothetical protein NC121_04380 [Blautia sp.]|nr:hypothetical protein [Blautia sp.]
MKIALYICEEAVLKWVKLFVGHNVLYVYLEEHAIGKKHVFDGTVNISKEELLYIDFNYLIILSQNQERTSEVSQNLFENGIPKGKILEFCCFIKNPLKSPVEVFFEKGKLPNYDRFIFGMSHSYGGLLETELDGNAYKFSAPSMDLYYHNMVVKDICAHYDMRKVKQIIFELPYYIFNYDISKCRDVFIHRMNYYYYYSDYHHFGVGEEDKRQIDLFDTLNTICCARPLYTQGCDANKDILQRTSWMWLLRKQYLKLRYKLKRNRGHNWTDDEKTKIFDFHPHVWYKKHIDTIEENIRIWGSIKELLSQYSWIDVKVVVFPFCPWFVNAHRFAINDMKKMFYEEIGLPQTQVIDCFETFQAKPECFSDECHLNDLGRYEFSKILARRIKHVK